MHYLHIFTLYQASGGIYFTVIFELEKTPFKDSNLKGNGLHLNAVTELKAKLIIQNSHDMHVF